MKNPQQSTWKTIEYIRFDKKTAFEMKAWKPGKLLTFGGVRSNISEGKVRLG